MTSTTVHLSGHIDVPQDRLEDITVGLVDHIRLTRQEPGCLSFIVTPHQDIPGRFEVRESFASQIAFDAHQSRTQASPWATITSGLPRDYTITRGN